MPRGRPPIEKRALAPAALNQAAVAAASAAADQAAATLAELQSTYDLGPFDERREMDEIALDMADCALRFVRIGARLLRLRALAPRGEWIGRLKALDLDARLAQRLMATALKFTGKRAKVLALGQSKAFELLVYDDAEIDALVDGGTIGGATLDEYERMSCRELRKTARKHRREAETWRAAAEEAEARRKHKLDPKAEARVAMLESISEQTQAITTAVARLDELLHAADDQGMRHHVPTNDALCFSLTLAREALTALHARHAIVDPKSIPAAIFAPAKA